MLPAIAQPRSHAAARVRPLLCSLQRHCNQPSVGFKSNLSACRKNWSTFSLLGFWTSRQRGSQHDLVPQAHITDISRLPGFRQLHRISPSIDPWYYTPCIYIKRLSFHFFSSHGKLSDFPLITRKARDFFLKNRPPTQKIQEFGEMISSNKGLFWEPKNPEILPFFLHFTLFFCFFPCLDTHSIGG